MCRFGWKSGAKTPLPSLPTAKSCSPCSGRRKTGSIVHVVVVGVQVAVDERGAAGELEQWNDQDEYTRCIQALNAIPEDWRDYRPARDGLFLLAVEVLVAVGHAHIPLRFALALFTDGLQQANRPAQAGGSPGASGSR